MPSDWYTKTILTVIALCLIWICCNGAAPIVSAQAAPPAPMPVVLVNERGVPLIGAQGLHVNLGGLAVPVVVSNQTLPVAISNQTLQVVLTAVERHGSWEPLMVDFVKQPPTPKPTP